ncbi:MAG: hypothetical protein JSW10_10820 [Pseudomonadota bacterium]|nr:MAG: hypothetical protein JSW10_10820 [Pseudomonadota bacterium]
MLRGASRARMLLLGLALTLAAGSTAAQQAVDTEPCAIDIERFCAAVQPGIGRVNRCLDQFQAKLTDACKLARQAQQPEPTNPCDVDIERYCADVRPGIGRVDRCLKRHQDKLSDACTLARQSAHSRQRAFRQACAGDVERLCPNIHPSRQETLQQCLKKNEFEVSEECDAALEVLKRESG